jgi:hypothetical protein
VTFKDMKNYIKKFKNDIDLSNRKLTDRSNPLAEREEI